MHSSRLNEYGAIDVLKLAEIERLDAIEGLFWQYPGSLDCSWRLLRRCSLFSSTMVGQKFELLNLNNTLQLAAKFCGCKAVFLFGEVIYWRWFESWVLVDGSFLADQKRCEPGGCHSSSKFPGDCWKWLKFEIGVLTAALGEFCWIKFVDTGTSQLVWEKETSWKTIQKAVDIRPHDHWAFRRAFGYSTAARDHIVVWTNLEGMDQWKVAEFTKPKRIIRKNPIKRYRVNKLGNYK